MIEDLDNVCWGDRLLETVRTEFQGRPYSGAIKFERTKTGGCEPGDRFIGTFQGAGYYNTQCEADVTVEFVDQSMANITWTITNAKNQADCPVRHTFWQSQVVRNDPQSNLGLSFTIAEVAETPAKIRTAPNGALLCTIPVGQSVKITSEPYNGWYRTDACSTLGYVHDDALIFFAR
ncbi:MAG: SH3 domain-containing protein [Limnothrix sp. RL_2_0]|nr:SH3 domain-containing protein [Limnothrix sp. RL_2_0]